MVAHMSKRVILPDAVKAIRVAKSATDERYKLGRFATTVRLSSAHLCNIEADRKTATEDVINRIAEALEVPVSAISYERPEVAAS